MISAAQKDIICIFWHFYSPLRGSCDVKWFDTAKDCQFRFKDLFHVVRSRCWFYSLPLFCVGSPPWLALVAAAASAALRSTGGKKERENKFAPDATERRATMPVGAHFFGRTDTFIIGSCALTVAFCAAFLLSKAEPGPPRAALSQHFCSRRQSLCGSMHQGSQDQRILWPQEEAVGATVPQRYVWQCPLCRVMQTRPPRLHCSHHAPPWGKTPPRVEQVSLPSLCFPGKGQAHSSWNEDWVHQEASHHQALDHQNPTGTGALAAAHCRRRQGGVWWGLWFGCLGSTEGATIPPLPQVNSRIAQQVTIELIEQFWIIRYYRPRKTWGSMI